MDTRRLATLLLLTFATPALAMNWEGKEDWMADMEQAQTYAETLPHAAPKPAPCTKSAQNATSNPYEQVPLRREACDEPADSPRPGR